MFTNLLQGVFSITAKELGKQIGLASISFGTNQFWMLLIDPSAEDQLKVMQKLDQVMDELKKVSDQLSNIKIQIDKFHLDIKMDMIDQYVNNIESLYDQYLAALNKMAEDVKARYVSKPNTKNSSEQTRNRVKELGSRISNETYKDLKQIHKYLVEQGDRSLFALAHKFYFEQDFFSYFCAMKSMLVRYFIVQVKALDMLNLVFNDPTVDFTDGDQLIQNVKNMLDQQEKMFFDLVPKSVVQLVQALAKDPERASVLFQANTGRGIHFGSLQYGMIMTRIGDLAEEWYLDPMQPIINPDLQQKYYFRLIHAVSGKSLILSGSQYGAVASDDTRMGWQIYCAPNGKFWLEFKGNYSGGGFNGNRLCINPSDRKQLFHSNNKNNTDSDQQFTLIPLKNAIIRWQLTREQVAWTVFNNKLCLTYKANETANYIWITSSSNGKNWSEANKVPGQSTSAAPALAVFNNKLYLAYKANETANYIWITSSSDGKNWSEANKVPGQSTSAAPALAVFNNKLYLAFKANETANYIWITSSSDGKNWSETNKVPGQSTSAAPALAVFNNKLYLAFKATDPNESLCITSSSDGKNWSETNKVPGQSTSAAPALAVFNNKLYLAFKATDSNESLCITSSSDGKNWSDVRIEESISASPSLAEFNSNLLLGWVGKDETINIMQV